MWKTHVAPVKTTSLPRLELMVAVTATKLAQFGYSSIVTKQPIAFGLAAKLCYTGYIRETTLNRSFLIALRRYVKPFNQSIGHSHCQAITQLTYLKGTYLTITWETYEHIALVSCSPNPPGLPTWTPTCFCALSSNRETPRFRPYNNRAFWITSCPSLICLDT